MGKPVAAAALVSRSLKNALKKGVAIGYSVNEQVTGHFEVLMSRSLARKLKIGGTPALGLPAGTPPQLVIAKAILVTTKGGHSVVHVKLPKSVIAAPAPRAQRAADAQAGRPQRRDRPPRNDDGHQLGEARRLRPARSAG